MIVEAIITHKTRAKTRVEREAKALLERWPGASLCLLVRRGPPGVLRLAPNAVAYIWGGFKSDKVRLGSAIGPSTSDLYKTQRDEALVILRNLGFLGELAKLMAQGDQKDAEATLLVARDVLERAGLNRLDHQNVVEMVRSTIREFETELS